MYRIAHSELMQLFREQKNKRCINADIGDLRFICEETQEFYLEEYIPLLKKVISELDPEDCQMVELRFFERRAFKEIGEIMDITENNAKVRMYRILEKLKKAITSPKKN
ncbi:MAG: sigma-70 family RNA polymerase sigma factor [Sphingobacteriaceae bacterium]|nr:sigma-70 family RNA polymerase sigma factor [Sphingobacteriaceae bacterium]